MNKVLRVILILLGVGAVAFVLMHHQAEARRAWDEILERVPTADDCDDCDDCTECACAACEAETPAPAETRPEPVSA